MASKKYPKAVLRCAYTSYKFQSVLKKWQLKAPIPCPTEIQGVDRPVELWFPYPEYHEISGTLLTKGIDCSHNFIHLRVRTCTMGVCGVSSDAWKACARSNETILKISLVEDLIDKQSVPNARTNFCEEVEQWMRQNGYEDSANLTHIIRNWYAASDDSEIGAMDRIRFLLEMRDLLMDELIFLFFTLLEDTFKIFQQLHMRGFNGYWHKVTNVHNCCAVQHPFSWKSCSGNYSRYPPVTVPQQPSINQGP